jgi:hypothetical protein
MLGWVMDLADVLQNPPNLDSLSALSALGLFFHALPVFRDGMVAYVATEILAATAPSKMEDRQNPRWTSWINELLDAPN